MMTQGIRRGSLRPAEKQNGRRLRVCQQGMPTFPSQHLQQQ